MSAKHYYIVQQHLLHIIISNLTDSVLLYMSWEQAENLKFNVLGGEHLCLMLLLECERVLSSWRGVISVQSDGLGVDTRRLRWCYWRRCLEALLQMMAMTCPPCQYQLHDHRLHRVLFASHDFRSRYRLACSCYHCHYFFACFCWCCYFFVFSFAQFIVDDLVAALRCIFLSSKHTLAAKQCNHCW